MRKQRIKLVCVECGWKFRHSALMPECPACGGVDVEPASEPMASERISALLQLARMPVAQGGAA